MVERLTPTGTEVLLINLRYNSRFVHLFYVGFEPCAEAPKDAPVLELERALDAAEKGGARLCSLCGAASELDPVLRGFDHIGDSG